MQTMFWVGVFVGAFLGAAMGAVTMGICAMGKEWDDVLEDARNWQEDR